MRVNDGVERRLGSESHGEGNACCHQSLKDKLKRGWGEQRKMVPSFPGGQSGFRKVQSKDKRGKYRVNKQKT